MRKLWTVCIVLVMVASAALAGSSYQKEEMIDVLKYQPRNDGDIKMVISVLESQIAAAKAANLDPNPAWSTRLEEMYSTLYGSSHSGSNSLDQGGETAAAAVVIGALPYADSGTDGLTDDCAGRPYNDVFYVYTAANAGNHTVDMCGSASDSYLRCWTAGTACAGVNTTSDDVCNGDDPSLVLVLSAGQVVYFECGRYSSTTTPTAYNFNLTGPVLAPQKCCYDNGMSCADLTADACAAIGGTWYSGQLCATSPCPFTLAGGDNCSRAVALPGIPVIVQNTTVGGTDDDPGVQCALGSADPYEGSNTAPDKWYTIIGDGNTITVSLCGTFTSYDTQIAVYCGDCAGLNCVAGNDDAFSNCGAKSLATFCSNAGTTYYVVVDGWGSGAGNYELAISTDGVPCTGAVNCSPIGRCCYTEVTGAPACADVTAAECAVLGGTFDAASTCAAGPCGGSCCYVVDVEGFCGDHYACMDNVLAADCEALSGIWTAGGSCELNACPTLELPCVCRCDYYPNSYSTVALDATTFPVVSYDPAMCVAVNVPMEYHITDLNVSIDFIHTYDGDVAISIISPMGTTVVLSDFNGGGGDNYLCTEFDDEAVNLVTGGVAPFNGSWIPENALSAFDGENAVGTWYVCFDDQVGGDDGYVIGTCLKFEYDYILPVAFGSFDAVAGNERVTLNWNTSSETSVDFFELSRDGAVIANVDAQNSATGANYTYTDENLTNGTAYMYSLTSVDVNGDRATLATQSVTPGSTFVVSEYALHQNYPNPFNPTTNIAFDMVEAGNVSISIFNIMGQKVAELVNGNMEAGRHVVNFDATGLSSGLYLYKMEANGFTAQSKMILMK